MAALVPEVACHVSIGKKTNWASKNDSSLIRDKCCHLTLCLRLVIVSDLLERSSKRDRDVAEGVDDVRAAQVPGEENEAGVYTKAQ